MDSLLEKTILWRSNQSIHKFHWIDVHLSTIHDYFINLCPSCHFANLRFPRLFNVMFSYSGPGSSRIRAKIAVSFTKELHQFFRVPELRKFLKEEGRVKKHQLVQVFLSFLLQSLNYYSEYAFYPYENEIENLEKEVRYLRTVLGDKSWMLYVDEHEEEFQNLVADFEAVSNEAGSLIYYLLFSRSSRSFAEMDVGFVVFLDHVNLLKANAMKFMNLLPCISKPAYATPGTSLVGSFILVSLIHDLEDLISREDNPIADAKDQIKALHQGFTFLQSSVKDVGLPQSSETGEVRELVERIGNMAHQTEYLVVSFLSGEAPLWYLIDRLTNIIDRIEITGTELQEIAWKHNRGKLKVAECFKTQLSVQDKGSIEIIVDFEDRRETDVLNYLTGEGEGLRVISIFGMPGLGKTTLAKKLFDHPSVNSWFDKQSWCVVPQIYKRQSICAEVLTQINGEFGKDVASKMDLESLVVHIHKTLYRRRYLIVLDDVWDSNLWDDLMRCFPDNGNGSRILFTTRNKDVGPSNCRSYALSSLSKEECWELLKKKVFGNNTCPPHMIKIGKKIASNCWGLPLAVVVVAGILSSMDKERYIWQEVEGNLASYIFDRGDNTVMQILELSFKHLPQRLKPCFLYVRAFTEDREIPVRNLKRLWISEGFIHKEQGKNAEDVAEEYLTELINKNLVMVAKRRSDGGVKTCVLHDLLRDLCFKICEDENFLKEDQCNIYDVYENGICHRNFLVSRYYKTWIYCQQVRSVHSMISTSDLHLGRMRLLRVLHYEFNPYYLNGFEYLVNLRYLVARVIPASVGCLVNLEYLRVEIHDVVYLPPAVLRMTKLRYLNMHCARYGRNCSSAQTNNLELLSYISIRKPKDEEMLKCSPNLRKLKCMYKCGRTSSIFDLSFLSRLQSLKLGLYGPGVTEISFPSSIKRLSLYGKQNLPLGMMSEIGKLENLEILKLEMTGFEGEMWETGDDEFQKLKFLKLELLEGLIEWNVDSSGHFPALRQLVLSGCKNLLGIPCEIGEIATLEMIEIKGQCKKSLVKSAKLIKQQKKDMEDEDLPVLVNGKLISLLSPSPSPSPESASELETQA